MKPPFTPMEAMQMRDGIYGDWEIVMEGPQMSPPDAWFPCVTHLPTQTEYVPTGEETTPEWFDIKEIC